jgi:hypothetical protein
MRRKKGLPAMADAASAPKHLAPPSEASVVPVALAPAEPAAPDMYESPIAYLKAKGWRCLGPPEWPTSLWIDPTRPIEKQTHEEVCRDYVRRQKAGEFGRDGSPVFSYEKEDLKAQDGSGVPGQTLPIKQVVVDFPAEPVPLPIAIQIEREREYVVEKKARQERKWSDRGNNT